MLKLNGSASGRMVQVRRCLTFIMCSVLGVIVLETVWYGNLTFSSAPHIDDWDYANLLFEYLSEKRESRD